VRPSLESLAALLPTPTAKRATGYMSGSNRDRWRPTLDTLVERELTSPEKQDQIGATTRPRFSDGKKPPAPLLNPCFVEWMLGAPEGWSDPDCPHSAMAFKSRLASSSAAASSSSIGSTP